MKTDFFTGDCLLLLVPQLKYKPVPVYAGGYEFLYLPYGFP